MVEEAQGGVSMAHFSIRKTSRTRYWAQTVERGDLKGARGLVTCSGNEDAILTELEY